ncbi:MAG: prepilin-type N-terminal cleavage/methylation domain-containing protein [Geobacter sp.]|nr:MAG: prepilin-type N-terminal cleavage/methylation domain-containing protein [Geobacter sp.]
MSAPRTISPSGRAGFSLVEMLMAMLVATVGLLGLLQSVIVAYQHAVETRCRSEAVQVAEERLHTLSGLPFAKITGGTETTSVETRMVGGVPWTYTVTSKVQPAGSTKAAVKLTVAITWNARGEAASHEIYTLRTRRVGE